MWSYNYSHSSELTHYGIKGMKWGVRRFQDKSGRLTAAGKKRKSESNESAEQKKKGLTDKQKRAIKIGVAVAGTALVAYGAYRLGKSGKLDGFINKGKQAATNVKGLNEEKSKPNSISSVIKGVNPTKSKTNCRACALASVLKLKGLDVEASDIPGGSLRSVFESCFTGARYADVYDPTKDKIVNYISKKYSDGDYGAIASGFKIQGKSMAHAYNWIVENGKVRFFDGQKEIEDFSNYLDYIDPGKMAEIVGLTNAEPNLNNIYSFVKRRG